MIDIVAGMEGIAMLPHRYRISMLRYIERHIRPNRFLSLVLSGDIDGAIRIADEVSYERINDYEMFLDLYAPQDCFGSPEKYEAWLARRWAQKKES